MKDIPSLPASLGDRPAVVDRIEYVLRELIGSMEDGPPGPRGRGAPAVLPAVCLWAGMLVCVLRGFSRQLDLWRLLALHGLWDYPLTSVCDEAVYDRLARSGDAAMATLFVRITQALRERLAPFGATTLAPFAREVVALDETTLDVVTRHLPAYRTAQGRGRLPGKLATLFDLRLQQFCRVQLIDDVNEREQLHARDLVAGLPAGSLILADLAYFGFAWFDDLTDAGYHWLSRLRAKVSWQSIATIYDQDGISDRLVWLGTYRADGARHAVRLITITRGTTTYRYVTNVTNPLVLPLQEVPPLYARRWDVELAYKLLKRELNLHLLWSGKTAVIHQQIWATLIIAQILLGLWVEVAGRAEVDVFDVSLALLVRHAPLLAKAGRDPVAVLVAEGRRTGIIRPASRRRYETPPIPPDRLAPVPPDLVLTRPARHATGQGSIPITPADTVMHAPPQPSPIDPHRRGRGHRSQVP
jgi:DDE family transposase